VIATSSELPNPRRRDVTHHSIDDDDDNDDETAPRLVGEFYVLQYLNHHEPVHGFLGRHLRRRLIAQSHLSPSSITPAAAIGCRSVTSDLARVVDWLPRVWQKVNKFLEVISPPQLDITIGRSCDLLFSVCP